MAVADDDSALAWDTRYFGRSPDVIVAEHEAMWQVTESAWIYVVGDASRAGSALLTLLVEDLDGLVAELSGRGLAISAIDSVPGLYRTAVMTDPEGNKISLGLNLGTGT